MKPHLSPRLTTPAKFLSNRVLYALHDTKPGSPKPVLPGEARLLNKYGYGIFWCTNDFEGARRRENLTRINAWYIDCDSGTKNEMVKRLASAPLRPSMIVETARGYHAYWFALDATLGNWANIVRNRLMPAFHADTRAGDVCRLLRVPEYYHYKERPFLVRRRSLAGTLYSEDRMLAAFEPVETEAFWPKADSTRKARLDAREWLPKLSGHPIVNGDEYKLELQPSGKYNIWSKRPGSPEWKSTGCFVDTDGWIGGMAGSRTLYNWCEWYGHAREEIIKAIRELQQVPPGE